MKVLLAGPDHEENLSIRYLASSLARAGHEAELATFNSAADIHAVAAAAQDADIVGLSMCFQSRAQEYLALARAIKSRDAKRLVVAGGHYASCAAEELLANHPELDVVVLHEGERTLVEIAEALPELECRLPQIAGVAYRSGGQVRFSAPRTTLDELDALPLPDRRGPIHTIAGIPTSYMMGSRGCYGCCAYCCITTLHRIAPGKRFRQRSVANIAGEMAELYRERGTRQFVFHDDNFLVPSEAKNHARIGEFERELRRRDVGDIALVIKCRPADAQPEVLRRLKELGLVRVFFGIESATERGLASLERKQTVGESERALEACAALDISAQFTLMIFNPDATAETMRADVAFMRRFAANPLNFCRAEIYAGTPLEQRMIALGRARGDYLARVYSMSDAVTELACNTSLNAFLERCWSGGSLMQNAIGLDHTAAVAKRFYRGANTAAACDGVARWLRAVNLDTIELLSEVIERAEACSGKADAAFERAMQALAECEEATRAEFLHGAARLRSELEALSRAAEEKPRARWTARLQWARQVAAALLAVGMPAASGAQAAMAQETKSAAPASTSDQAMTTGTVAGTISDPTGAVIPNAKVTMMSSATGKAVTVKSDQKGEYAAAGLSAGQYTIRVEAPGFNAFEKTGVIVKGGATERADVKLAISSDIGCCEYAAVPMVTNTDWINKTKPFTYTVGQTNDDQSLKKISQLVYGDESGWVELFDANRKVVDKPSEQLSYGTSIVVPPRKRIAPKLAHKIAAAYPAEAIKKHLAGQVVLDVTLKDDGSVEKAELLEGEPPFAEAAIAAVKQWRYQVPLKKGEAKNFAVVISFNKHGRVTIEQ